MNHLHVLYGLRRYGYAAAGRANGRWEGADQYCQPSGGDLKRYCYKSNCVNITLDVQTH